MFQGSMVALVTPMKTNGSLDMLALEALVDWHIQSSTEGLVVLGTTGEAATIDFAEREALIKQVVRQVSGRIPVIVGTGVNSTSGSVHLTRHAKELGADAALVVTPYYNKPTQEGLYQHYQMIVEQAAFPVIMYNVPSRTACDLRPATVERLSELEHIVGLKEATGGTERLQALLARDIQLDFFSGDDKTAMDFMLAGGQGVISVAANLVPLKLHDLCQAALNKDTAYAHTVNESLSGLYDALFFESNPIPCKWLLAQMGWIEEGIRLPLTPLAKEYHANLRAFLEGEMAVCEEK